MSTRHLDPGDDARYIEGGLENLQDTLYEGLGAVVEQLTRIATALERLAPPQVVTPSAQCTCTQTPNGLVPTTANCPIHGSWTYI